jgi:hypothetical protein
MFDFFIRFAPKAEELPPMLNPFMDIEAYHVLEYNVMTSHSKNDDWYVLSRRKVNWVNYYSDDNITLIIFGYLFERDGDTPQIKSRFTARELKDWWVAGNRIYLDQFKGSYTVVVSDHISGEINVVTDPLNVRNVHYFEHKGTFAISSSVDAIIAYMRSVGISPAVNRVAFFQQYMLDFILQDETLVQDVHSVPAGHRMKINKQGLELTRYWDIFREFQVEKPRYGRWKGFKKLNIYLREHVRNHVDTPIHTSIALTGGYDSRALTALLGKKAVDYSFFSYGYGSSWDMSIPKKIAEGQKLRFQSYRFDKKFEEEFEENVKVALSLSQGTALFTQANIPFIYRNYLKYRTSILTGLFGSELIKFPSGRGLFVDENMLSVLMSKNPRSTLELMVDKIPYPLNKELVTGELREKLIQSILQHPVIDKKLNPSEKFFFYLVNVGARKYFSREIAMERPFVDNLHPFWDVDFIKLLLQTPYTWVHHWSDKKNFFTNVKLHRLYAKLIFKNNKQLSFYISSHATRPIFLISNLFLPFLAFDYFKFRKKIKNETILYPFKIQDNYLSDFLEDKTFDENIRKLLLNNPNAKRRNFKIVSLVSYLRSNNLSI